MLARERAARRPHGKQVHRRLASSRQARRGLQALLVSRLAVQRDEHGLAAEGSGAHLARVQEPDEARNNITRARELYLSQIATIEGNIIDETGRGRVWQVKKLEKERDRIKENVATCDDLLGEKPLAVSH